MRKLDEAAESKAKALFQKAEETQKAGEHEAALALFKEAAEMGYVPAYTAVGTIYTGWGGDVDLRDEEAAVPWARRGVEAGDPDAMSLYSGMFDRGIGVKQSAQKSFYWAKRAYETRLKQGGNPHEELRELGCKYIYGRGVKRNLEKGIALQEQAADLGNVSVLSELGNMYAGDYAVKRDLKKALAWYLRAAEADPEDGVNLLDIARIYEEGGDGIEKDWDKAAEWYEKAAKTKDGEERFVDHLIRIHTARKDTERADYWRQRKREQKKRWREKGIQSMDNYMEKQFKRQLKEAEAGDPCAMVSVAWSYQSGSGVEKDGAKAVEWHTKAKDWHSIAKMYQTGDGVEQDLEKAAMYYEKALDSGYPSGEDIPLLIRKLRAGDDGLPKNIPPSLTFEELQMDGEALWRRAALAERCEDHKRELLLYQRAAEIGYIPAYTKLGEIYAHSFYQPSDEAESIRWLRRGMEAGDPEAFYEMSEAYCYGRGVERDDQKIIEFLEKAAALGYPRAMNELGHKYRERLGVAKDIQKAIQWYEKAAEMAGTEPKDAIINYTASSMHALGNIYAKGEDVPQDMEKALEWYKKSWAAGERFAWRTIAEIYQKGEGSVKKDEKKMLEIYRQAADMGEGDAIYKLGRLYAKGTLVEKDKEKAFALYLQAAEKRDYNARVRLAQHFSAKHFPMQGAYWQRRVNALDAFGFCSHPVKLHRGIFDEFLFREGDLSWAEENRYKAEVMGDADAMFRLGHAYMHGIQDLQQDKEKGIAWYRKAIEAGNSGAMNNLGVCYEKGNGVEKDLAKAVALYQEAAELRDGSAMYHLGDLAEKRNDKKTAVEWYEKAAKQWEVRAITALGKAYETGGGKPKDEKKAAELYRQGAQMDNYAAILALARLYGVGDGIEGIQAKAKELITVAKDPERRAFYEDIEDFILDEYGNFLTGNTKEGMTEEDIAQLREKDEQLMQEMNSELDAYLQGERGGTALPSPDKRQAAASFAGKAGMEAFALL